MEFQCAQNPWNFVLLPQEMRLMFMPEELRFEMDYKGEKHGYHYNLASADEQDVANATAAVSQTTNPLGFLYAGFSLEKVDSFVEGMEGSSASEALNAVSSSDVRSMLKESVGEKAKLAPAAEAYFFHRVFSKHSLPALVGPDMLDSSAPMEKTHPKDRIALLAKYKSWVAIKKMSIDSSVQDYEVSGILCAINETLVRKAFDFTQVDQVALETEAKKLTKGKRKSYSAVGELLSILPEQKWNQLENTYLLFSALSSMNVRPYAHREMLSKQYKDIKPPKPRGRMPKA
ncbi:DUF2666 domain-containing protein [Candidatus Micrarchaeota archaeon]|nr:DUF2666 domain-containing protein [Candidatus Micrarchaeota archaeon]